MAPRDQPVTAEDLLPGVVTARQDLGARRRVRLGIDRTVSSRAS
jgi:hypothetical protein